MCSNRARQEGVVEYGHFKAPYAGVLSTMKQERENAGLGGGQSALGRQSALWHLLYKCGMRLPWAWPLVGGPGLVSDHLKVCPNTVSFLFPPCRTQ